MKILLINRNNTNTGVFESISLNLRFTLPLNYYLKQEIINDEIIVLHETHSDIERAMNWADRIVINRGGSEKILRIMNRVLWKKTIYDIDDNIFIMAKYAKNLYNKIDSSIYDEYIKNSEIVTVSNKNIESIITERYKINNLLLLPITVKPEDLPLDSRNAKDILIVNGDAIKLTNTKQKFINEVNTFLALNPSLKIDYIGDVSNDLKKFKNINFIQKMTYTRLSRLLKNKSYKCALVPLGGEDDFDICKSPIKYFQNGIFGIPGIYSNKNVYTDFIKNEENGILVDNLKGTWSLELEKIYDSANICNTIIQNSYGDVSNNHTYINTLEKYKMLFS